MKRSTLELAWGASWWQRPSWCKSLQLHSKLKAEDFDTPEFLKAANIIARLDMPQSIDDTFLRIDPLGDEIIQAFWDSGVSIASLEKAGDDLVCFAALYPRYSAEILRRSFFR